MHDDGGVSHADSEADDDDCAPRHIPDKITASSVPDPFATPVPSHSPGGPTQTYMTLFIENIAGIAQKMQQ